MVGLFAQFGVAGLIGWMWLTERRSATSRETQLNEAHTRLMEQRVQLEALMQVVEDNTKAVAALQGQLRAIEHYSRWRSGEGSPGPILGAGVSP